MNDYLTFLLKPLRSIQQTVKNKLMPLSILEKIVKENQRNYYLIDAVASNPNTTGEILKRIYTNSSEAVAKHHNCPIELLKKLTKHPGRQVRIAANQNAVFIKHKNRYRK